MTTDVKEKSTSVLEDFEKAKNKFNTLDYTQEEFEQLANLYTESFRDVKQGEMVKGRLVRIQGDNVIIDVGFKSEGTIPRSEFGEDATIGSRTGSRSSSGKR
jgi:small subunit ribosomal protein S1